MALNRYMVEALRGLEPDGLDAFQRIAERLDMLLCSESKKQHRGTTAAWRDPSLSRSAADHHRNALAGMDHANTLAAIRERLHHAPHLLRATELAAQGCSPREIGIVLRPGQQERRTSDYAVTLAHVGLSMVADLLLPSQHPHRDAA